jgi:cytochrome b561
MGLRNSKQGYGAVARFMHWVMALLLVVLFALGWYMTELSYYDRWYKDSFDLHKSLGLIAFILFLFRIVWMATDTRPDLPSGMHSWEILAARGTHAVLYLLMLALPVSGYLISTADGHGVSFFGLFEIPALLPAAEGREELAGRIHYFLGFGGAWLVVGHVLAALKHHYWDRDDTLVKMLRANDSGAS